MTCIQCGSTIESGKRRSGRKFCTRHCLDTWHRQNVSDKKQTLAMEASGYTAAKPRVSNAPPLPSCIHCRAWGTIHSDWCPAKPKRDNGAAHRVAVEVARMLAEGFYVSPTVRSALVAWLDSDAAQADGELLAIARGAQVG